MASQFSTVIRELRNILNQLFLFESLLNTILLFLSLYFILVLINGSASLAFFPAIIYFFVSTYLRMKTNKSHVVEGRHDALREKLRTAADNMHLDNPLAQELHYEVTRELKNVRLSDFLNARGLSYKILVASVLSFGIIFSSTLNVMFFDVTKLSFGDDDRQRSKGAGDFEAVKLKSDDDIYGDDRVAELGDKELDIKIKPVDFKVSVKEEGDVQTGNFQDIFPKDAILKEGEEVNEDIPKEQQELVKRYFKKLAGS